MQNNNGARRAVLLVDPAGDLSLALGEQLRARCIEVTVTNTPLGAVRAAMTIAFDAVVCDLQAASMNPAGFEAAIERVRPSLAGRCLFVAPSEAPRVFSESMITYRPLDLPEILRTVAFLAAQNFQRG